MKKMWFKAKRYGWGWYPATWQGWLILGVYLVYILYRIPVLDKTVKSGTSGLIQFILEVGIPTILLIVVCYLTGEKPKWRWGK